MRMGKRAEDLRVVAFFADGLEECEALVVCDLLWRAHIPCDKISVTENLAVTSSHGVTVACDGSICDEGFSFEGYDLMFLPGGMPGTKNLRACEQLCRALAYQLESGRDVAAVCAAPSVLAELGLLEGRRATSNPGFQAVLAQHGAEVLQDGVVVDGQLITSQGLGTCIDLGLCLVERYLGSSAAEDVKGGIVYQR